MPNNKVYVLSKLMKFEDGTSKVTTSTHLGAKHAEEILNQHKNELLENTEMSLVTSKKRYVEIINNANTKYIFSLDESTPTQCILCVYDTEKDYSEEEILKCYHSLESLCETLDSCFDLYDLGYVTKKTQKNYNKLALLSAVDLWARWKTAHGLELY